MNIRDEKDTGFGAISEVTIAAFDTLLISKLKELWYIVATTGRSNLNAEFVVKDLEELHDFVYNRISHIDGVQQVEPAVIMKYVKRRYDFGMPLD